MNLFQKLDRGHEIWKCSVIQRNSTGIMFLRAREDMEMPYNYSHFYWIQHGGRFFVFLKASKPTFYWVFACARLADVAARGVELQQRRSADRFGGSSLRHRACGASDDQTAKWPSTEYTRFDLSRQVRNTNGKASLAPRTRCCHGIPSSFHVSLQVA